MDKSVAALVKEQGDNYFSELPNGKLLCSLNGHEVPARLDALQSFTRGSKYLRMKSAADAKKVLAKYEPFLVKSRNFEDKLYCSLTCQLLGMSVAAVRQHMRGKKFQRAKAKFEADETDLVDEPPLDSKAQQPETIDMNCESEAAALEGTQVSGSAVTASSPAEEEADLWIPGEYASMEAEATAEARAESRIEAGSHSALARHPRTKPKEAEAIDHRRPKPGKKHKLKRQRVS